MAGCQLSYYTAVELSNAGTATVLQYTAPVMILAFEAVKDRRRPDNFEIAALIFALVGTIFSRYARKHSVYGHINGRPYLGADVGSHDGGFINLLPIRLMKEYGTFCVIGWGMFAGGIILSAFTHPWHVAGQWDLQAVGALAVVIVVGTVLSFSFYMEGVRMIGAAKASLWRRPSLLQQRLLLCL